MTARDPLSVAYDSRVRRVLLSAIAAHKASQGASRGVVAFVASPAPEFRRLDRGGRTAHERAFTRAAYYQVFREPRSAQELPAWSLKLTWGKVTFHGGRWGRPVRVRLYRYSSGYRHAQSRPQWITGDAARSVPGARIDA